MGYTSVGHWVIVALVVLILFGRGKISQTMGEVGRGIQSFRNGLADSSDGVPRPLTKSDTLVATDPAEKLSVND